MTPARIAQPRSLHAKASVRAGARRATHKTKYTPSRQAGVCRAIKYALLFDCDGVIVETEELHRLAYNGAFEAFDLYAGGEQVRWSREYYDVLANTVGGGKPKMRYHFTETLQGTWPSSKAVDEHADVPENDDAQMALIDALQDKKTEIYKRIVEEVAEARPGVIELMDEALARDDVAVAICSAATRAGFDKVVNAVVGVERLSKFDVVLAGDDVDKKKPDPLIYNMARERLPGNLEAHQCLVIEDSVTGLRAAKAADMLCLVTPAGSNLNAPFMDEGADFVVEDIVQGNVSASSLFPPTGTAPDFSQLSAR